VHTQNCTRGSVKEPNALWVPSGIIRKGENFYLEGGGVSPKEVGWDPLYTKKKTIGTRRGFPEDPGGWGGVYVVTKRPFPTLSQKRVFQGGGLLVGRHHYTPIIPCSVDSQSRGRNSQTGPRPNFKTLRAFQNWGKKGNTKGLRGPRSHLKFTCLHPIPAKAIIVNKRLRTSGKNPFLKLS